MNLETLGKKTHLSALFSRIGTSEKILFAKNTATMLEAGLPLTRALSVIERQARKKRFKAIIKKLNDDISKGDSLSLAMSKSPQAFSAMFVSMVKAGEESGGLAKALRAVGNQTERAYLLTKKIRGAMMYPGVIFSLMVVIGVLMMIFVVPTLTAVFKSVNVQLPLSTRIIIGMSDFLKNHFLIAFLGVLIIAAGVISWARTTAGNRVITAGLLRLPFVGSVMKETNSARTGRTLSSLISAGVDFLIAIRITSDVVQNVFYKEVLKKAEQNVEKGKPISEVFLAEEKLYPAFVGEMASIGEETGRLGEMFENVATYYENEVEQRTKDMSTVIEPVLMVVIGIAVGIFAISMLSPIYSLVDAL